MPHSPSNTTFVFVPGAWHDLEAFSAVGSLLESSGNHCSYVSLPSVGAVQALVDFQPDVEAIKTVTADALAKGRDVVMVMHSYGGSPAGEAIRSLEKDRAANAVESPAPRGSIVRMAYISAFAMQDTSLMDCLGGQPLSWFEINDDGTEVGSSKSAVEIFYQDLPATDAAKWTARLQTHSYRTMFSKMQHEPWMDIPSSFLVCEEDRAIPVQAQDGMIAACRAKYPKAFDLVERCGAGHSPFLSMPETVCGFLERSSKV